MSVFNDNGFLVTGGTSSLSDIVLECFLESYVKSDCNFSRNKK